MDSLRKILASNIRSARKAKGWSQTDMAVESGVSFGAVQAIEQGKKAPRETTISAIAGALGVSVESLYSGSILQAHGSNGDKDSLLVSIFTTLPTLNDRELRAVWSLIDNFPKTKEVLKKDSAG